MTLLKNNSYFLLPEYSVLTYVICNGLIAINNEYNGIYAYASIELTDGCQSFFGCLFFLKKKRVVLIGLLVHFMVCLYILWFAESVRPITLICSFFNGYIHDI